MKTFLAIVSLIVLALFLNPSPNSAQQQNSYILQSPSLTQAQAACQKYGLTLVSTIKAPSTYLVTAGSSQLETLKEWMEGDPNVEGLEVNKSVNQSKHGNNVSVPVAATVPSTVVVTDKTLAALYGASTWAAYVQQPAFYATNVYSASVAQGFTGQGIIGVIDTGVDEQNPVLASAVIPGYDFTRGSAGYANDFPDLDQSTAHILHQSTAHILHGYQVLQLDSLSSAILDADTAAALQGTTLPNDFGHGTMVAGLIHLVAPGAKIMPLKAFKADGTANESDIVAAIYYAADNGVNVLNMSFGIPTISDAMMKAINYANRKGVVCIASVGNDGVTTLMYPASFGNVIGVASVNGSNQPSSFTNTGADMVTLAAPGEALVTTYPGPHYAAVSGTSFSSALVAGAADILLFQSSNVKHTGPSLFQEPDVKRALQHAIPCVTDTSLGAGCFDMSQAIVYMQSMVIPASTTLSSKK